MPFSTEHAREIDLGYAEDPEYGDAYDLFWGAVGPLPVGSVVAAGWPDSLAYWRRESNEAYRWTLVQLDHSAGYEEPLSVGYVSDIDPNDLSAGGDIEVAFIVRRGWGRDEATATWLFDSNEPELFDNFRETIDALPNDSVIAAGFVDEGLVYYRKVGEHRWRVEQVDDPNVADALSVGECVGDDTVDANGGVEVAYVVRGGGR